MPVIVALQFMGACLVLGLGLFLAAEAVHQVNERIILAVAGPVMAALGALTMALVAGYWVATTVPW